MDFRRCLQSQGAVTFTSLVARILLQKKSPDNGFIFNIEALKALHTKCFVDSVIVHFTQPPKSTELRAKVAKERYFS